MDMCGCKCVIAFGKRRTPLCAAKPGGPSKRSDGGQRKFNIMRNSVRNNVRSNINNNIRNTRNDIRNDIRNNIRNKK